MKKILSVLFASLFFLVAGNQPDVVAPYLARNSQPLDLAKIDLSLLGSDLDARVFLSGAQWHGTSSNYDLQYALLTGLYRQAGVRVLLLDQGYATAQAYNDYLQTGNTALLKMAIEGTRFSNSSNNEHRLFWEKLCQFNLSLPAPERIKVLGIDVEYQADTALGYLDYLSGRQFLNRFPVTGWLGDTDALRSYIEALQASDPAIFEEIFGDNLHHFQNTLKNLVDTVVANTSSGFYAFREKLMYSYLLDSYEPAVKYFGHFTMEHVYQRHVETGNLAKGERLAMLANQEGSPFSGKVVSLGAFYHDSEFRFYYGKYDTYRVFNSYIVDPLPFLKKATSDFTLFKLNGSHSPFAWGTHTVVNPTGGTAIDYYQYLILIRNSKATSPNLLPPS